MDTDSFKLEEFIPHLMRRISAHLSKSLTESLKPFGQTPNTWRVLLHLKSHGECTLTELSAYTLIEQSTLSRTIDMMGSMGLIQRTHNHKDGRVTKTTITDKGHSIFETIFPIAMAQSNWALSRLTAQEVNQLRTTLINILDTIRISPFK